MIVLHHIWTGIALCFSYNMPNILRKYCCPGLVLHWNNPRSWLILNIFVDFYPLKNGKICYPTDVECAHIAAPHQTGLSQ